MVALLWLRRDLRLADHPALAAAYKASGDGVVVPLFVTDPALLASAGDVRVACLHDALTGVHEAYEGALVVRHGDPADVVPAVAAEVEATSVHVTAEPSPYGRRRDARVDAALAAAGCPPLAATGSPYAVTPGRVLTRTGAPYQVFTPFSRAWRDHGWPRPAHVPAGLRWGRAPSEPLPARPAAAADVDLPRVTEAAALERWHAFRDEDLEDYATARDRADLSATSALSVHLKYGTIHPRTLLADLFAPPANGRPGGTDAFVNELCWREFNADVLWHRPDAAWADLRPDLAALTYDDVDRSPGAERFAAWAEGRTGYPFVDAGLRQLLREGWVHNRVRMVVASFLVKDLHVWWGHGARHFLRHLRDGDVASNNLGWQWVAGTGSDAAPYFRVFNPVTQGERFDPRGDYVRRYVPELRHLAGGAVHQPWRVPGGLDHGYPGRVVDHAAERLEALRRYEEARAAAPRR